MYISVYVLFIELISNYEFIFNLVIMNSDYSCYICNAMYVIDSIYICNVRNRYTYVMIVINFRIH